MNYKEAIEYVENTARFGMKLGLERTERILELLDNPHKKIKTVHIAGTNGKGSTTAMINSVLVESGYTVGMYTSPYIEEFEERMQVNNRCIEKDEFAKLITEISAIIARVIEEEYGEPTYFEIITCAAFLYFYRKNVDLAIIEVGLGGRLDSTNVIIPEVSVITSISFDHMNILGNSLEDIAFEKGGIIKKDIPLILYPQNKSCEQVLQKLCDERNSSMIKVKDDDVKFLNNIEEKGRVKQLIEVKGNKNIYNIKLNLLGKHQLLNCTVSIYTLEKLIDLGYKITKESIENGLAKVRWLGRMEIMNNNPMVVIDGAHNIDGIKSLKDSIDTYFKYNNIILILGILADKEVHNMVKVIAPIAKKVITVTPHSERAKLAHELKDVVSEYNSNCVSIESYEEAYEKALGLAKQDDLILISGSLYMIGDMRKIIRGFK